MKAGRPIKELAVELERQELAKRDFVANTKLMEFVPAEQDFMLKLFLEGEPVDDGFTLEPLAHRQMAERLKIPQRYYDRMMTEGPGLLSYNVNYWFRSNPEERLIRTLDGKARAFLSNRYRRLDNFDLMKQAVIPVFTEIGGLDIASCEITDSRLYIKAVTPRIQAEVRKGDVVQAGIVISNSEVGLGAIKVEPLILRLACINGMVVNDYGMRRYNVGKRVDGDDEKVREMFSDETLAADDKAFWLKARDIIKGSLTQDVFEKIVDTMRDAADRRITVNPVKVIEVMANDLGLNAKETDGVLTSLLEAADLTQYGLVNAITAASKNVESYDRATELERMGGDILTMSVKDWKDLQEEAA